MRQDFDDDETEREDDSPEPPRRRRPRRPMDDDEDEQEPDYRRRRRSSSEDDGVSTIIPYKNPKALIAYYCGVFGLVPCLFLPVALAAIVLGILGLRYAKEHPTAKGKGHAIAGLVLGGLSFLAQFIVIAILIGMAVVNSKK